MDFYKTLLKPIIFVLIAIIFVGLYSYRNMETSLFPNVTFPKITIIADNGEQPVDKMMIDVTKPLELAVKRVNGINTVRSSTNRGSCTIDAFFDWNTDINLAKIQLEARINEIKNTLPSTTDIVVEAMSQSIYPVMGYTIESKNYGQVELKNTGQFIAKPLFAQVPGISNVIIRGGKTKEFVVSPIQQKMSQFGISPQDIIDAMANTNFVESSGLLSNYRRLYLTLTDTRIKNIDELRNIIIKNNGNRITHLYDIAKIDLQEQNEFIRINANGGDAVIVDLVKQEGVNLTNFAQDVYKILPQIQKQLPKGMIIKPYYDQSVFVSKTINSALIDIYIGLLFAILVAILFLRSFRASLSILVILPVTLTLTLIALKLLNISLDIMSLGAVAAAIGLIIDDAIVVIEQLHRMHEENPDKDKFTIVRENMKMFFPPMIGSSLSTIVIFLPFGMMSGVAGSFFKELTLTMIITLICSFLTTWIGLPALHLLFGYKHKKNIKRSKSDSNNKKRLHWLVWFFNKPWFSIGFIILLIASAVFLLPKLKTGFLPVLDEGSIVLDYIAPAGTTLEESDAMLRKVDTIVMHHPDVATYMRRIGTNMASGITMGSGVIPPNFGDYLIQLKPGTTKKTEQVIAELRSQVEATEPALEIDFGQRISDLLGDLIGRPQPIDIKIFGDDQTKLQDLAIQVQNQLNEVKGVADVFNGIIYDGPSFNIIPNQEKLALYNISPVNFQTQIKTFNKGIPLGQIQEKEQMLTILLRSVNFQNNDIEKLKDAPIFSPDGTFRQLYELAVIEPSLGDPELTREDFKSDIEVTARLDNRDIGSAINEIKSAINKNISLPTGYYIVYGGAYEQQQSSFNELLLILLTAIVLVFTVLLFLFKDLRLAALIIFIAVLGIAGSIWALFITNVQLNVGSYTGLIMIVGIIAENAIFTTNQFLTTYKSTSNIDESINYAISLRIRPKLMTAIGAILALMPLALGIGIGAQMQQPLAIAVIGGFIFAMPLLLIVFPTLLRVIYKR